MEGRGIVTAAGTGAHLAEYYLIYGTYCLHCHRNIDSHAQFMAVGPPFNGCLHMSCAVKFHFNPEMPTQPHPRPTYSVSSLHS